MTHATFPTYFDLYNAFAEACDIPKGSLIEPPNRPQVELACRLVDEEWNKETLPALQKWAKNPSLENLVEVADGIGDTIYVLCQLARAMGVPLNQIFNAIHSANMQKVDPATRKVTKREDGKVLKPEGWEPPDIFGILEVYANRECVKAGKMGAENWPKATSY